MQVVPHFHYYNNVIKQSSGENALMLYNAYFCSATEKLVNIFGSLIMFLEAVEHLNVVITELQQ